MINKSYTLMIIFVMYSFYAPAMQTPQTPKAIKETLDTQETIDSILQEYAKVSTNDEKRKIAKKLYLLFRKHKKKQTKKIAKKENNSSLNHDVPDHLIIYHLPPSKLKINIPTAEKIVPPALTRESPADPLDIANIKIVLRIDSPPIQTKYPSTT